MFDWRGLEDYCVLILLSSITKHNKSYWEPIAYNNKMTCEAIA